MKGLPLKIIDKIEEVIGTQFDEILMDFLGIVPKLTKEKKIIFTTTRSNLTSLFLQSLGHRKPSQDEEEALKGCLRIASNYVEALKQRTQARAVQNANAYAQETFSKGKNLAPSKIRKIIVDEMGKAQNHLKLIVNSETNKAVNTGTALQIQRVAEDNEDKDPTVFFQVTIDDVTGPEEFVLHLLPDRKTPRYWKLSEIGAEYHKVGDPNPKLPGLHPNCRCKLTYLPKGFGHGSDGKIKWMGPDYDGLKEQRKEFPKPR